MTQDTAKPIPEYRNCMLCPRMCGANRTDGETGVCGETAACRVASTVPHHGEEPSFSGSRGSGTVFFAGCSCQCFFCQNDQVSHRHLGTDYEVRELLAALRTLIERGVHNLNFVTPTHFWPHVRRACEQLRREGTTLPFLYNTSGYERPGLIPEVAEQMDVFMPDMKFASAELADACTSAPDYPETAMAALAEMVKAKGFLEPWDPTGNRPARTGVLVRHLVLPGEVENTLAVLRRLRHEFGRMLPLSVMSQFRPMPACRSRGLLERPVTAAEYGQVTAAIRELDFQQVYIQPHHGDDNYLPDFTRDEPFRGNRCRNKTRP